MAANAAPCLKGANWGKVLRGGKSLLRSEGSCYSSRRVPEVVPVSRRRRVIRKSEHGTSEVDPDGRPRGLAN